METFFRPFRTASPLSSEVWECDQLQYSSVEEIGVVELIEEYVPYDNVEKATASFMEVEVHVTERAPVTEQAYPKRAQGGPKGRNQFRVLSFNNWKAEITQDSGENVTLVLTERLEKTRIIEVRKSLLRKKGLGDFRVGTNFNWNFKRVQWIESGVIELKDELYQIKKVASICRQSEKQVLLERFLALFDD